MCQTRATDPSHRLLLATAFTTATLGAYTRKSMFDASIGMFLGFCNDSNWEQVQQDRDMHSSVFSAHGSDSSSAAGRVSYLFGLKGPCFSVNTACSSSLVALDSGHSSLALRKCDRALVAGVNLQLHITSWNHLTSLRALSPDGLCKTLDSRADGFGRSEAWGAVMLELNPGSKSISLAGIAVNQDGRSASFMAPHAGSQEAVIRTAMQGTPLSLKLLMSVEIHGTGTALGDPKELGALSRVLSFAKQAQPVTALAIKSQVAHSEGAAGLIGLVKVLYTLRHQMRTPNLQMQTPNSKLPLEGFSVFAPSQLKSDAIECMGVSSFGFSGTNSHATLKSQQAAPTCNVSIQQFVRYLLEEFCWWEHSTAAEGKVTEAAPAVAALLGAACVQIESQARLHGDLQWERVWPEPTCSYMAQHCVAQTPLTPGTAYLCMVREAFAFSLNETEAISINQAQFIAMMFLDGPAPVVQVAVSRQDGNSVVRIDASVAVDEWVQHALVTATGGRLPTNSDSIHNSASVDQDNFRGVAQMQHSTHNDKPIAQRFLLSWSCGHTTVEEHTHRCSGQLHQSLPHFVTSSSAVKSTYLRSGQLEILRTQRHLYKTAWVSLPVVWSQRGEVTSSVLLWAPAGSGHTQLPGSVVASTAVWSIEEACIGMDTADTLLCRFSSHNETAGLTARLVQAAASYNLMAVWLVTNASRNQTSTGSCALARSVNAELMLPQFVRCLYISEATDALTMFASIAFCENNSEQTVVYSDGAHQTARLQRARVTSLQPIQLVMPMKSQDTLLQYHRCPFGLWQNSTYTDSMFAAYSLKCLLVTKTVSLFWGEDDDGLTLVNLQVPPFSFWFAKGYLERMCRNARAATSAGIMNSTADRQESVSAMAFNLQLVIECALKADFICSSCGIDIQLCIRRPLELAVSMGDTTHWFETLGIELTGQEFFSWTQLSESKAASCEFDSLSIQRQLMCSSVNLQIKAAGVSFIDVLNALGVVSHRITFGDCAGVVCGDAAPNQVFGLARRHLESYTSVDRRMLVAMPAQWSYEEASAMPSA